jgi:hypothetical protein
MELGVLRNMLGSTLAIRRDVALRPTWFSSGRPVHVF